MSTSFLRRVSTSAVVITAATAISLGVSTEAWGQTTSAHTHRSVITNASTSWGKGSPTASASTSWGKGSPTASASTSWGKRHPTATASTSWGKRHPTAS
jgi:hypothetical protein